MSDKQAQKVAAGGVAVQSAGDTTINAGISPSQMKEIMECLADQLPKYAAVAASLVEERLKTFEEKIVNRFEEDASARREAFQDPDFQFLITEAQKTFARNGDDGTIDILSDLLIERSKESGLTRKALNINRAISIGGLVTKEEISAISLSFLIRKVKFGTIYDPKILGEILEKYMSPYIDGVTDNENSYIYMEALGCGKLSIGEIGLADALAKVYPDAIKAYMLQEDYSNIVGPELTEMLLGAGIIHKNSIGGIYKKIDSMDEFRDAIVNSGIPFQHDLDERAYEASQGSGIPLTEVNDFLRPYFSKIDRLLRAWDETPLKSLELSSVGIALGYSSAKRLTGFDADSDIWLN